MFSIKENSMITCEAEESLPRCASTIFFTCERRSNFPNPQISPKESISLKFNGNFLYPSLKNSVAIQQADANLEASIVVEIDCSIDMIGLMTKIAAIDSIFFILFFLPKK